MYFLVRRPHFALSPASLPCILLISVVWFLLANTYQALLTICDRTMNSSIAFPVQCATKTQMRRLTADGRQLLPT
jgi:hypothetical protein